MKQIPFSIAKPFSSPWKSTGCLIERYPWWFGLVLFWLFWIYRSQYYSGDGDQLARMVEAGVWMVQTELISHAAFQLAYLLLSPWGWDGLSVINLVSCIAGAVSIVILLKFNSAFVKINPIWVITLFASSGFLLYCNGHTEYYTLFLMTMFYYGYAGVGYLQNRCSMLQVSLAFAAAVWMHLGILFAFPTLMLLPLQKKQFADYRELFMGQLLLVLAYFVKIYYPVMGIPLVGLSPSWNMVPWDHIHQADKFYIMFDWNHLADIIYAWIMRSWIFWPVILWAVGLEGFRSLLRPDRLFLLLYTLAFTFFTLIWHPDLGIIQDWDLYAIEAAPCLLLLLTYLPTFLTGSFHRFALAVPVAASMCIMISYVLLEAHFERRDYGSLRIQLSQAIETKVTMDGHAKTTEVPAIREGIYSTKIINTTHMRVHDIYTYIAPHHTTIVPLQVGPNEGRGQTQGKIP